MKFILWLLFSYASAATTEAPPTFNKFSFEGKERVEAYEALEAKDLLGREKLRPKFPGSHRALLGAQLDETCILESMEKLGASRFHVTQAFERLAVDSFNAIEHCQQKYPELDPYLNQWVSLFRRSFHFCPSAIQETRGHHYAAFSMPSGESVKEALGSEFKDYFDFSPIENRSLPRTLRPTVLWYENSMTKALTSYFPDLNPVKLDHKDLFIHELLHATDANNRSDHNEIELELPGMSQKQGEDMTADRIMVISSLCARTTLGTYRSGAQAVFRRIDSLGFRDGCEKLFTEETQLESGILGSISNSWRRYYFPSKGLQPESAAALCRKLESEGRCDDLRYGELGIHEAALDPILVKQGQAIRRRLDALFPPNAYALTPAYLELLPETKKLLEAEENKTCVSAFFDRKSSGNFVLTTPFVPKPPSRPSIRIQITMARLKQRAASFPDCATFAAAIVSGHGFLAMALKSSFFTDVVEQRYFQRGEKELYEVFLPTSVSKNVLAILGEEISTPYLDALKSRHPKSFHYKCAIAGK